MLFLIFYLVGIYQLFCFVIIGFKQILFWLTIQKGSVKNLK